MASKVVITGGPCGGKTSVIDRLAGALKYEAVFAPEAASIVIAGRRLIPQPEWTHTQWQELQRLILDEQLRWEQWAEVQARREGRSLIILDRAPYDNLAYPAGWDVVHDRLGLGELGGFGRYDLVIHMESLATARPSAYGKLDNAARYETLEQAQALELRSREAWRGHPNWHFVGGSDLHTKYLTALKLIAELDLREVA